MNPIILLLMLSDFFVFTGFGLIDPIIAIFISDNVAGGTIFAAGLASTLFLITKNMIQLPFSRYVDSHDNDSVWLIIGSFIIALIPLLYIFAKRVEFVYLLQILYGVGCALAYPAWLALWSTHLDKNHESFEWSSYSALTGFGVAITGVVGAAIAEFIGFTYTFILTSATAFVGCLILFKLLKLEKAENRAKARSVAVISSRRASTSRKRSSAYHSKRKQIRSKHY